MNVLQTDITVIHKRLVQTQKDHLSVLATVVGREVDRNVKVCIHGTKQKVFRRECADH